MVSLRVFVVKTLVLLSVFLRVLRASVVKIV